MKKHFILLFSLFIAMDGFAQVKWGVDSTASNTINWQNYSTSFVTEKDESIPTIITAIPYNGMYSNFEDNIDTSVDISHKDSLDRFTADWFERSRNLYTFDSSEVYFLAAHVSENNAAKFEYRIILDGKTVIIPWKGITKFSNFQKGCGFLGGYKTDWGHFFKVELRRKDADTILSSASVYWKEIKPELVSVYTSKNLNDFFILLKRPWDRTLKIPAIPQKPEFSSTENMIIFYYSANIYKKEALEYELIKDGHPYRPWGPNDYDNNFIMLKQLAPGQYQLHTRFWKQRHNPSTYNFTIRPQWHETLLFKIVAATMSAVLIGFIFLLLRQVKQREKAREALLREERNKLELKSIRSQLNPHFIFNALSSIQGLINKNDTARANKYLTEFSSLLRDSLKNNDKELVPLQTETRILETYIKLEQLRFHFKYSLTVSNDVSAVTIEIPSLIIQPLVENAIKHGIAGLGEKGYLTISFYRNNKDLLVDVTDNGKGFDTLAPANGFGLKLTKERIVLLNQSFKNSFIELTIKSSPSKETTARLRFQNWL